MKWVVVGRGGGGGEEKGQRRKQGGGEEGGRGWNGQCEEIWDTDGMGGRRSQAVPSRIALGVLGFHYNCLQFLPKEEIQSGSNLIP